MKMYMLLLKDLNRTLGKSFGDEKYSKEELVAEIEQCFVQECKLLMIAQMKMRLSYIQHWLLFDI